MDPEKSSNLNVPLDAQTRPISGATTPDLIAGEKEQQNSHEPSTVGGTDATPDGGPVEQYATEKRLVPLMVALEAKNLCFERCTLRLVLKKKMTPDS
jgi:hypothetical protein